MALKLKLRPKEHVYINGVLLRNGDSPSVLEVLNKVPLLRQKDILLEQNAQTPCQRLYFIVQTLYFAPSGQEDLVKAFSRLALDIVRAAPSTADFIEAIHGLVSESKYYSALRKINELIEYEKKLFSHVQQPSSPIPQSEV